MGGIEIGPSIGRRRVTLLFLIVVMGAMTIYGWSPSRVVFYRLYRAQKKERTLTALDGYRSKDSAHFRLFYTERDEGVTDMILDIAESAYAPVMERLRFWVTEPVPVIVYPTRQELRAAFGWGSEMSAVGVYWNGVIRLLSPSVWIPEKEIEVQRKAFRQLNPIAHELTHYVLDYATDGNYPRWFSEGLAQYVEYKISGYLWIEPESALSQRLYTLEDLQERFEALPNQPLAYHQSYLLIDYMGQRYGEAHLTRLLQRLQQGLDFSTAVLEEFSVPLPRIYQEWAAGMRTPMVELRDRGMR